MSDPAARADVLNVRETRRVPFRDVELRASGDAGTLHFTGYACVTEEPYEICDWYGPYAEVVRAGAFAKTLGENADVAFLVNHEGMTLARTKSGTLRLAEDATGLHVDADLDPSNPLVQSVRSAMDRSDMDEMSFAFRVTRQQWSPDYDQRDILEVSLSKGDVSLVNYGANPATAGASLRGLTARNLAAALSEVRAGAALSSTTMATLRHVLSLAATADDAVDEAQQVLADLMGVANPDEPEATDPAASAEAEAKSGPSLELIRAQAFALGRRAA